MKKSFLLIGLPTFTQNYGCEAIARGTYAILEQNFSDFELRFVPPKLSSEERELLRSLSHLRIVPQHTTFGDFCGRVARKLGVTTVSPLHIPERFSRGVDIALSIGGDLYTFANKEDDWPFPWRIVKCGNMIMDRGIPLVIWCASVGPLEKAGNRLHEIVAHLKRCTAIILREPGSYHYLRDTLGLVDNTYLSADPAFVMPPEPIEAPSFKRTSRPLLAVNLSYGPIDHVFGREAREAVVHEYEAMLKRLIRALDLDILLVPHVDRDFVLLDGVHATLRKEYPDRSHVLPKKLGASKTKWAVAQCDALVTMRFHCSLAGLGTETPTLLLVSTEKGRKQFDYFWGQPGNWQLEMSQLDASTLENHVAAILESTKQTHHTMASAAQHMKSKSLEAGSILKAILS